MELLLCTGANPATICDAYGFDSFDLEAELRVYKKDDDIVKDDITTVIASYKNNLIINMSLYPIIFKILKLIVVLPATNASSERSFFALSRLKTAGRTSMMQDRLNHLYCYMFARTKRIHWTFNLSSEILFSAIQVEKVPLRCISKAWSIR